MIDKDILTDFQGEARTLLEELSGLVETLEEVTDRFPAQELEQFAQRIDRIMGAAQTLNQLDPSHQGLMRIGAIAQVCKRLGYKAAENKTIALIPLFAAFWADTLEVLEELLDNLEDEAKSKALASSFSDTLQKRLQWLGEKVQKLAPGSGLGSQQEVDKLLAELAK